MKKSPEFPLSTKWKKTSNANHGSSDGGGEPHKPPAPVSAPVPTRTISIRADFLWTRLRFVSPLDRQNVLTLFPRVQRTCWMYDFMTFYSFARTDTDRALSRPETRRSRPRNGPCFTEHPYAGIYKKWRREIYWAPRVYLCRSRLIRTDEFPDEYWRQLRGGRAGGRAGAGGIFFFSAFRLPAPPNRQRRVRCPSCRTQAPPSYLFVRNAGNEFFFNPRQDGRKEKENADKHPTVLLPMSRIAMCSPDGCRTSFRGFRHRGGEKQSAGRAKWGRRKTE